MRDGNNCFNCKHSQELNGLHTIRMCGEWRSGCFETDVTDTEVCNRWEAAEDEN